MPTRRPPPTRVPGQIADRMLRVKLTPTEEKQVQDAADRAKQTVSAYVRKRLGL